MIISLLFIVACTNLVKSEDDDQKYIDLLPESEKKAFLDIVARRLIKDVQYKHRGSAESGEVPEDELDKHDEFVKNILREERNTLRNDDIVNKVTGEESLTVKGFDKNDSEDKLGNMGYIDLTLRNGERIRRNSAIETEIAHPDKIPVQIVYDTNISDSSNVKNLSESIHLPSNEKTELSDSEDIQARESRRQVSTHTVINDYEPEDETTEKNIKEDSSKVLHDVEKSVNSHSEEVSKHYTASMYDLQGESNHDLISDHKNEETSTYISNIADNISTSEDLITLEITKNAINPLIESTTHTTTVIQRYIQNETEVKQNRYLRSAGNKSENNYATESSSVNTSIVALERETSLVQNNGSSNSNIDRSKSSTSEIPKAVTTTDTLLTEDISVERSGEEGITGITDYDMKIKDNSFEKENRNPKTHTVTEITTITDNSVTIHPGLVRLSTVLYKVGGDFMISNKNVSEENKYVTTEVTVSENLNKVLRSGIHAKFDDEDGDADKNSKSRLQESLDPPRLLKISKPYEVYEIPAGQPPFIEEKKQKKTKLQRNSSNEEQPHYFSIYNYSPDKAYFNSYNRLGPNDNETHIVKNYKSSFEIESVDRNKKTKEKYKSINSILRKFKFNQKRSEKENRFVARNSKANRLKMPDIVKNSKLIEMHVNPNDYLDMDYYFGRSRHIDGKDSSKQKAIVFPDSDDEDHVFNTMKTGQAKDLTRATRQILYGRHMFGHNMLSTTVLPLIENEEEQTMKLLRSFMSENKKYSVPVDEEIALDYYFGVQDDNRLLNRFEQTVNIQRHNIPMKRGRKGDKNYKSKTAEAKEVKRYDDVKKGTINEILAIDPIVAFLHLDDLNKYNIPLTRTREDPITKETSEGESHDIKPFLNILRDMISSENEALAQYDWLSSTVDIQSALAKLLMSIENLQNGMEIHPSDVQMLKYIQYLLITSKSSFDEAYNLRIPKTGSHTKKESSALPRSKRRKREYLKVRGLLDRAWLYIRGRFTDNRKHKRKRWQELQQFLEDIQSGLYDLHDAIRSVATITRYNNQKWFQNLKQLYLKDSGKKQCLEVLLHLTVARIFDLVETAAKNGAEDNYELYIERHEKEVRQAREEIRLLLKVLVELKYNN